MTNIVIPAFSGRIPRMGDQQLPPTFATVADNCLLMSGELRGLHVPAHWATVQSTEVIRRVFRIEDSQGDDLWLGFNSKMTHMVRGPLVNDRYNRYYWTSDNDRPRYNTLARIEAGDAALTLGVPRPRSAPTVTADGSGSGLTVTRAYVYTFVTEFGEEGPASDPTVAVGKDDDTWNLGSIDAYNTDPDAVLLEKVRVYRTITGTTGAAEYYLVAEVDFGGTSYADAETTGDVSLNTILGSTNWYAPPESLKGIVVHPNGFLVGFSGKDLYFSEPFRPHAWPAGYVLSTEEDIVGLGVFGTSIAVLTRSYPYIATGISPAGMTFTKTRSAEPCQTPFGIVSRPFGVYYPSPNGLQLVRADGVINTTKEVATKDEWLRLKPKSIIAARYQEWYLAFNSKETGFIFAPEEENAPIVDLKDVWNVDFLDNDPLTGEVYLLRSRDCVSSPGSSGDDVISNGGFETYLEGVGFPPWVFQGSATGDFSEYPKSAFFGEALGTITYNDGDIFTVGETYTVSIDVHETPGGLGTAQLELINLDGETEQAIGALTTGATGTFEFEFTATHSGGLYLRKSADSGGWGAGVGWYIDNISVAETTPGYSSCSASVSLWNPPWTEPITYKWRSKEFQTAKPVNFGVLRSYWKGGLVFAGIEALQPYIDFNTERFAAGPLNPINSKPIGGSSKVSGLTSTVDQMKTPDGGSPLFDIDLLSRMEVNVTVRIYGNETLRYTYLLPTTLPHRVSEGYRCERWKIEFEGTADVANFKLAETGKELASI